MTARAAAFAAFGALSCSQVVTESDLAATESLTTRTGTVGLFYFDDSAHLPNAMITSFRETTWRWSAHLDRRVEGPARSPYCTDAGRLAPIPTMNRYVSAGDVTVSDGRSDITQPPGDNRQYDRSRGTVPAWREGARLTVTSAGGEIPSFMTSVVVPSRPAVTSPVGPGERGLSWTRAQPLTIRRLQGGYGDFVVYVFQNETPSRDPAVPVAPRVHIVCTFPGSVTEATLPAAALRDLRLPTTFQDRVQVSIETRDSTTISAGDYQIEAAATYSGPSFDLLVE
ncbi:MAG: hypothetical protein R3A48_15070 [Polyangiales bacterium]